MYEVIIPGLKYLAENLNEIHWGDRLNPWNHSELFPKGVTGMSLRFAGGMK